MHTCAYMTGAAQHPGKREALDFVLLHAVTLSVFLPAFVALDWLVDAHKARLLEAAARVAAVMYAGCGCPGLDAARVVDYDVSEERAGQGWEGLFKRAVVYEDEGHVAKVVRALFSVEGLGETAEGFPIGKGDFVKIAHMAVDSVERAFEEGGEGRHRMPEAVAKAMTERVGQGGEMVAKNQMRWVFYGGLDGAWNWIPDLKE